MGNSVTDQLGKRIVQSLLVISMVLYNAFGDELRVGAEFEFFHPMGLEVMFFPDALHAGGTDPLGVGHQTDTPMGRVFGPAVQGGFNHRGFSFRRNLFWATGARSIFQNAGQPFLLITSSPEQNGG
jgi:hypothetical protein